MRITMTRAHEGKVDDLFDLLTDPDSIASRRADLTEPPVVRGSRTLRGGTDVEMRRVLAIDESASVDRIISPVLAVCETIAWEPAGEDETRRAAITTAISGAPVRVVGTYELRPTVDGCTSTIELDLSCTMAMLGGRLMAVVRDLAQQRLVGELDSLDRALGLRCG